MSREEFLALLKEKLKCLPTEDQDDAMRYYEEFLDDAGPDKEASAIAELGSPEEVASKILSEYAMKQVNSPRKKKKGLSTAKFVFLAICAAPVAAPIIALAACAMILLIAFMALGIAAVWIIVAGLALGGVCNAVAGFSVLAVDLPAMAFRVGLGLLCLGAVYPAGFGAVWLSKSGFQLVAKLFSKILRRKKA